MSERNHSLQTYYLLAGKQDRKGKTLEIELDPNSTHYQRLATSILKHERRYGETPAAGQTWRQFYESICQDAAAAELSKTTCQKCRKEPVSRGETICIRCQYTEKGDAMFTSTVEHKGFTIKVDGAGRAHIPALAVGQYWPIFPSVRRAKAWVTKNKNA